MILHFSLRLFQFQARCGFRWENLDRGQYPFQPIKCVNLIVPNPVLWLVESLSRNKMLQSGWSRTTVGQTDSFYYSCETEPCNKLAYKLMQCLNHKAGLVVWFFVISYWPIINSSKLQVEKYSHRNILNYILNKIWLLSSFAVLCRMPRLPKSDQFSQKNHARNCGCSKHSLWPVARSCLVPFSRWRWN